MIAIALAAVLIYKVFSAILLNKIGITWRDKKIEIRFSSTLENLDVLTKVVMKFPNDHPTTPNAFPLALDDTG